MNVLFVGLGSIGRRNLEACLRVRPNYRYAALRSGKSSAPPDELTNRIALFSHATEVSSFQPRVIWVCNPTAMHRETVDKFAAPGVSFFIEKPLAHRTEDAEAILRLVQSTGEPFFYGCILREHPLIQRVKQLLDAGQLGRVISYQTYCGSYLPDWRPNRDYRDLYSAQKDLGGGAALDLVHDFDYPTYWFGPIQQLIGEKLKLSTLELDADDHTHTLTRHTSDVVGQTTVNYYRRVPRRSFEILCTNGVIEGDLIRNTLQIQTAASTNPTTESHTLSRDDLHDRQARRVFETLEQKLASPWQIEDAAALTSQIIRLPENFSAKSDQGKKP